MNYIILNGKKSTDIDGLLISSLPPISKPLKRTQIEEIDGRDGDIVTVLGYAAYNKQITIGLHGNYNVDDVIAYFDSEGTVIFSNEPNKYYYYQILNQIDFARLIRFKTATVTLHVQPFKYSAVEKALSFPVDDTLSENNLLSFSDYTITKNGITLAAKSGKITIRRTVPTVAVVGNAVVGTDVVGTDQVSGRSATEIYMPINRLDLAAGNYTLDVLASGVSPESCSIRLIYDSPSSANSFGGKYVTLSGGDSVKINEILTSNKSFNYLYFYITGGTELNFTIDLTLVRNDVSREFITNTGNIDSKPKITIYGSGTINLSLNGNQIFTIELGNEGYITIDAAQMEAYKDGILKNRLVSGDYENLAFKVGKNAISWTGNVSIIEIDHYSRWI